MKTLSVRQPWALLIFKAGKDVENRTWYTGYRGRLLIHASSKVDEYFGDLAIPPISDSLMLQINSRDYYTKAIIGSVDLVDCRRGVDSPWAVRGQFQWVLRDPKLFPVPIPCSGRLGLWEFDTNSLHIFVKGE